MIDNVNAEHGQRITLNHGEDTASTRKVLGGVAELKFALPKWLLNQPRGVEATVCHHVSSNVAIGR